MTRLEAFKIWVEALRSGKYRQGTGSLRKKTDEFCCLGVACDLFREPLELEWELSPREPYRYQIGEEEDVNMLPCAVCEILGLEMDGELPRSISYDGEPMNTLWRLNDTAHYTFDAIADVIEDQFIRPLEATN